MIAAIQSQPFSTKDDYRHNSWTHQYPNGIRPSGGKVAAITAIPMQQRRNNYGLFWEGYGGLRYYRSFLKNQTKRTKPITAHSKLTGAHFEFTSDMVQTKTGIRRASEHCFP